MKELNIVINRQKPNELSWAAYALLSILPELLYQELDADRAILDELEFHEYIRIFDDQVIITEKANKTSNESIEITKVLNELGKILGVSIRPNATGNRKWIKARLSEGVSADELIEVAKFKNEQWKNDYKMKSFLRPETLFGNKFHGYMIDYQLHKKQDIEWTKMK